MQWIGGAEVSRRLIALPLITLLLALGLLMAKSSTGQVVGGPVVLLGIDPEDISAGAAENHGGTAVYTSILAGMLSNVENGGSGILVIGGGRFPGDPDHVTAFWNAVGAAIPTTITFVNDETAPGSVAARSFDGFALIAVASSINEAAGGMTPEENTALVGRSQDIADFVDAGGGVFGLTQSGFSPPFQYIVDVLGDADEFVAVTDLSFDDITATAEGSALGLSNSLDVCCWHDEFTTFPSFLLPLATNPNTGNAVAVGRRRVTFQTTTTSPTTSSSTSSTSTTSTVPLAATTTTRPSTATSTTRPSVTTTTGRPGIGATSTTVPRTRTTGTMPLSS